MKLNQNDRETIKDRVDIGAMTVDDGNVEMVRSRRVLLVTSRMPASVRKALNAAVKTGALGHYKKDGHKPEAYFHPTFDYLAKAERTAHERHVLSFRSVVLVGPSGC